MPLRRARTGKSFSKSSKISNSGRTFPTAVRVDIPTPTPSSSAPYVTTGTVVRAHGVRGGLIVYADASIQDALRAGVEIRLARANDHSLHKIVESSAHGRGLRLMVSAIDTREKAEALRGAAVMVHRKDLPELAVGEYYDFELIGNRVVTADGDELGVITEVVPTGANDVYVVEGECGEILVPAAAGAVLSIDRDSGCVVVEATALEYSGSSRSSR